MPPEPSGQWYRPERTPLPPGPLPPAPHSTMVLATLRQRTHALSVRGAGPMGRPLTPVCVSVAPFVSEMAPPAQPLRSGTNVGGYAPPTAKPPRPVAASTGKDHTGAGSGDAVAVKDAVCTADADGELDAVGSCASAAADSREANILHRQMGLAETTYGPAAFFR